MEKKLKKIKLKKEVIAKLEENQLERTVGGGNFCPTGNPWTECFDGTCPQSYGPACYL